MTSRLPKPGDNGKPRIIFPGQQQPRQVPQLGGSCISVPQHVAAQRARELEAMFDKPLLAWCPKIGAHELTKGTECVLKNCPLPPHQPVPFYLCPTCKQMHMVAMVLVPKTDDPQPAEAPEPQIEVTLEQVFEAGKTVSSSCFEIWPEVAVYHVVRADFEGLIGRLCSKLTISAMNAEFVSCAEATPKEGHGSKHEIILDGDTKKELGERVAEFVRGMEDGESGRPVYRGPEEAAKTAWLDRAKEADHG